MCQREKRTCLSRCLLYLFLLLIVSSGCDREAINIPEEPFWEEASANRTGEIRSLAVNSEGHIFASVYGVGIIVSRDGGDTWAPAGSGIQPRYVTCLAVHDSGDIYAGTANSLYRSSDNGGSWTEVNTGLTDISIHSLSIDKDGNIYGLGELDRGVRSLDNGNTWEEMKTDKVYYRFNGIAVNDDGNILAGYRFMENVYGIVASGLLIRSTDRGETWTAANSGLPASYVYSIVVDSDGSIFAGTWDGVFASADGGSSWTPANGGWSNRTVLCIAIDSSGHLFAGTMQGIFRSTDRGDTWIEINEGITDRGIYCLAINGNDDIFVGTSFGVIFKTIDNGGVWKRSNIPGIPYSAVVMNMIITRNDRLFAIAHSLYRTSIARSEDSGRTWNHLKTGPFLLFNPIVVDAAGNIIVGSYGSIFRSMDGGESWTEIDTGSMDTGIKALAVGRGGVIYAGSTGDGVHMSKDNGDTWSETSLGGTCVNHLAVSPDGRIFAATWNGLYFSYGNCETWHRINNRFSDSDIRYVAFNGQGDLFVIVDDYFLFRSVKNEYEWKRIGDFEYVQTVFIPEDQTGLVFAGTYNGFYYSTDNGETWTSSDSGMEGISVLSLGMNQEGYLFAGTPRKGLYRSTRPLYQLIDIH